MESMRILLALLWLTSSAIADPGRSSRSGEEAPAPTVPAPGPAGNEGAQWQPYTPADRGGFSGVVIVPPETPDALPHPRGMVIDPPKVGDSMAGARVKPRTWSMPSLWQRFGNELREVWNELRAHEL
jgi:hypothetical protein